MNRICCYSRQTLGCVGCGKCCGAWAVPVSEEERRKIMALPLVGLPLPVEQCFERRRGGWYLKKKNRRCIFLDEEKKCRIHTQFGLEAKPLTCRLYPLDVWSWSDGSVSASLRCDCPAAAAGAGEELRRFKAQILQFAEELKKRRPSPADAEYSPVIAPLATDFYGQVYNINADMAACDIARSLKARKLVFLSDVPGILRDPSDEKSLISSIRTSEVDKLIAEGVLSGGMLPKIRSSVAALEAGTREVQMIDGRVPHSLLLEIFTDKGIGTEIVKG